MWTDFPPPEDFGGREIGTFGKVGYRRTLSPREAGMIDAEEAKEELAILTHQARRRDRFFGFEGGIFSAREPALSALSARSADVDRAGDPAIGRTRADPNIG